MRRKRVMVLYGGKADEHSISCISAAGVLSAIDTGRFEPVPIGITKDGQWVVGGPDPREFDVSDGSMPVVRDVVDRPAPASDQGSVVSRSASTIGVTAPSPVVLDVSLGNNGFFARQPDGSLVSLGFIDAVFPVLHGPYGEDGTVQGLLEMMGVPYVGCGVFASAACMDKAFTKALLRAAGIPVAPDVVVDTRGFDAADGFTAGAKQVMSRINDAKLKYPLFVKPSRAGSSFGVTKLENPRDEAELAAALLEASRHDWKVLVEQGIEGREIECAILAPVATEEPQAAWPGEIVLDRREDGGDQFYDFDSKYTDSRASHVEVPARLPAEVLERVRRIAVQAFKAVDGAGLSRVDTFVTPDGTVMVNEINTMPGFTPISMYPKAWQATGVEYGELISRLIDGVSR
ncbi:D-alanine-D-alanine ligase [Bifidobacterium bohemicum]|uniref:D-alanine--D-alanine ligase n=1 Tax=Bifidobacterium bohemicum DSM 22767 TaxID=1437606 RepID=A0A086ZHL7_9BIFI|nr:D-alanine--D-alanine ligase family protein [Bifidobacterium bohemicum]KFI46017.1 d-alanine--d-alanine ligase DdlA [Bifidobacterium bohemicum DSM 22767]SCC04826.1 D-alanine-D-alanine ligase [Bifidobacterium bohemicum]